MLLVARMLLVLMPFVTSSDALAPSSFLSLVAPSRFVRVLDMVIREALDLP